MKPRKNLINRLSPTNKGIEALLRAAARHLHGVTQDEFMMAETPVEVQAAIESAQQAIISSLSQLGTVTGFETPNRDIPGGPTRQQGQFLAFIREFILRNEGAVAPSHAEFQRFFNLSPPSVNSMLVRLEQRGFIRRLHRKARAIELTINPEWIPPLDRPFKF